MVDKTDLAEDVHHDTGISTLPENVQCNIGMEEGHNEDGCPAALAANLVESDPRLANSTRLAARAAGQPSSL